MDYLSIRETSEKWGIGSRRIQTLCITGRIKGAERIGHIWVIPRDAEKPKDARIKSGKYIKKGDVRQRTHKCTKNMNNIGE